MQSTLHNQSQTVLGWVLNGFLPWHRIQNRKVTPSSLCVALPCLWQPALGGHSRKCCPKDTLLLSSSTTMHPSHPPVCARRSWQWHMQTKEKENNMLSPYKGSTAFMQPRQMGNVQLCGLLFQLCGLNFPCHGSTGLEPALMEPSSWNGPTAGSTSFKYHHEQRLKDSFSVT